MRCGKGLSAGLLAAASLLLPMAAGAAEVLAPPGWTGQWDFTITYRSSDTGRVQQVDHVSTDICPSEPLGLALFASPGRRPADRDPGARPPLPGVPRFRGGP